MPELPEVETIKNELSPWVEGQSITQVTIFDAELVRGDSTDEFRRRLVGQKVESLERRGKYLILHLADAQSLVMHLKMTGALLLSPQATERYIRAIFHFSNDVQLMFRDPRRFGVIWLVADTESIVGKLGPEPLSKNFTPHVLAQRLRNQFFLRLL